MNIKQLFKPTFTLFLGPLVGICTFFGGWQMIPELNFLSYPVLLLVSYHGNLLDCLVAFVFALLGTWGSITGSLSWESPEAKHTEEYFSAQNLLDTFTVSAILVFGFGIALMLNAYIVRTTQTWNSALWFRICTFPVIGTMFWAINDRIGRLGTKGSPADTFFVWKSLKVGTSYLGGPSFGHFVVLGLATLCTFAIEKAWFQPKDVHVSGKSKNGVLKALSFFAHPVSVPIVAFLLASFTGSIFVSEIDSTFYQKEWASVHDMDKFTVGCMAVQELTDTVFFKHANQMAAQGIKFIITGESSLVLPITTPTSEQDWLAPYQAFASNHSSYLSLGYAILPDPSKPDYINRNTVIDTGGKILIKYDKNHGVPYAEDFILPSNSGPGMFQINPNKLGNFTTEKPLMNVLIAICFDGMFVQEIRRAAQALRSLFGRPTDIFLHNAGAWGSFANGMQQSYSTRAQDLGAMEVRCAWGAPSGVYNKRGDAHASYYSSSETISTFDVPLQYGSGTLFVILGDFAGWTCIVFSVLIVLYVIVGSTTEFGKRLQTFSMYGVPRRWETSEVEHSDVPATEKQIDVV
jgi:predicted amidohydrolase